MRSIVNIGFILSAVLILSFKSYHNNYDRIHANKTHDSVTSFVIFSVDAAMKSDNNNMRLDFYYHDSLAYGHPVTMTGKVTKLLLNAPTLLLEASAKQIPFLIYPAEKINIKYAGSDSMQMYVQGNQQRTNELNFFRKLVQKTGNIYYGFAVMPYLKKVNSLNDVYNLEKIISDKKNARLKFLGDFSDKYSVSGSFNKIAVNAIMSTAFTDTLLLYYHNRALLIQNNIYKKLITDKLTTIKNIGYVPFQFYFRACNMLVSMSLTSDPNHVMSNSNDFVKRFDFTEENFDGSTKDFLMSNMIYVAYTNSLFMPRKYLDKFNIECKDKGYKTIIEHKLNEKNTLVFPKGANNLLYADGKTVQDIQAVIAKDKGKMALVDFWASWCSPCRAEMPYWATLKKKYEGKNIVFVNISSDSNMDDWLKANKEEALGKVNSFLFLNFEKSSFMKKYKINSIPRYILIGKDGKIITDDAPRPSDPKLKDLIDKML